MQQHHIHPGEEAVLAVLGGTPIEQAARRVPTSPGQLAEAVERYRAAGRTALEHPTAGWYQAYVTFADYPTAARAFRAHLQPALHSKAVGAWWFLRKYPCWRLRAQPATGASLEDSIEHTAQALDSAVSWGVVKQWQPTLYEPETIAFGGLDGMAIAHRIFHTNSLGALIYDQHADDRRDGLLDAKTASLLVLAVFLRTAGLECGEQGEVWAQAEAKRALPTDVPPDKFSSIVEPMRKLLTLDTGPALSNGPLKPLRDWMAGMGSGGQALKEAENAGHLWLGLRGILARHVVFHWNRMGFSGRQQAIWSRAAREALLGH
ncbi:thiopeptide-type bacteriocin biosynthesis protein [Streptomyces olivochromogenes]|uniref:thiopeptide-type bacteriocin biosynthesis protein n=1 Tax=Streptomyces olivochromogenes TaxID=1963 RepID=UPI001F1CA731|nr:thiopeptide-type bacteriocin biosynthesis protein [Streptomyces olivochromogenes]MCF3137451.1 thiopeptide-type bacteriocin biosynthesis protein [Streptomyces olivochromogenes]